MMLLQIVHEAHEVSKPLTESYLLAGILSVLMAVIGVLIKVSINKIVKDREEKEKDQLRRIGLLEGMVNEVQRKTDENALKDEFTNKEFEQYKAFNVKKDEDFKDSMKKISDTVVDLGKKITIMSENLNLVMRELKINKIP